MDTLDEAKTWMENVAQVETWSAKVICLAESLGRVIAHLESHPQPQAAPESRESAEQPATTASSTTGEQWAVEASTLRQTLESWLLARATTDSLVARLFAYAVRVNALPDDAQILALAAQARRSIYPSVGSRPSVATSGSGDVPSPSGSSESGDDAPADFANDLCVNLGIDIFSPEGQTLQKAVIRTWHEQGVESSIGLQ